MAEKKDTNKGFESIVYYRTWAKMLRALPAELRCKIRDAIDDYIMTKPNRTTKRYYIQRSRLFSTRLRPIKLGMLRYAERGAKEVG